MKTLPFKQVDAFTARPFMGNPVAVVLGGEELDSAAMQRFTRWTNLSEATFVLPSKAADYRLRIFSPTMELPFAGHPTLGSAHAVIEAGLAQPKGGVLRQECGAGIVELSVSGDEILMKAPEVKVADVRGKLAFARKLLRLSVGPTWITGEAESAEALAALKPDMAALAQFSIDYEATGVTLFAASNDSSSAIHVRSFAPAHNIPEDPVCGSGNICVAAYLRATNQVGRFGSRYVARQGMQMGRDGRVSVRVEADAIWIGGQSVTCIDGTVRF